MKELFIQSGLSAVHFALAYAGMLIHTLLKLQEQKEKGTSFWAYMKKYNYSLVASFISIPVLLLLCTDTALKTLLPITYATSVFVGWQTQSIFKTVMNIASGKLKKQPSND